MWDSLSYLLTLLESFDKNNPEMGIDSVARQRHQKTVQHYWVNIVKQQVTGGGYPTLTDTYRHVKSANGGGFESKTPPKWQKNDLVSGGYGPAWPSWELA